MSANPPGYGLRVATISSLVAACCYGYAWSRTAGTSVNWNARAMLSRADCQGLINDLNDQFIADDPQPGYDGVYNRRDE